MNAADLNVQLLDAVAALRESQADLEERSKDYALAEKLYRREKATAYLATHGTVAEREAMAERAINEDRYRRDMAEGLKLSGLEAVRGNRAVLSAIQTLAALYRTEAEFDRTGPQQENPAWGRGAEPRPRHERVAFGGESAG